MSKNSVAAPSTLIKHAATLALALVVTLELSGGYALSQRPGSPEALATTDGVTVQTAAAQPRAASVEISIVAQADTPAR